MASKKEVDMFMAALSMAGVSLNEMAAETILETHKVVSKVGNKFTLKMAAKIRVEMERKYLEGPPPPPVAATKIKGFHHSGDNR